MTQPLTNKELADQFAVYVSMSKGNSVKIGLQLARAILQALRESANREEQDG